MNMSGLESGIVGLLTLVLIVGVFMWVRRDPIRYFRLIAVAIGLTLVLIVLGAFVRLSDAGLGCPDWPGCYGNLTPAHASAEIRAAEAVQPGGPVSMTKAWKEMTHRYLAMLGGITILGLLLWLLQRQTPAGKWAAAIMAHGGMRRVGWIALAVLFGQIILGGWVSTNYAALACGNLPTCQGSWVPTMDFANAFHIIRPLGVGPDGELLTLDALTAIHWTHRVGAIVTLLVVGGFALALAKVDSGRKAARMMLILLGAQVVLGLSNVAFSLPLLFAVAHNGVAALLFTLLLLINLRMAKGRN